MKKKQIRVLLADDHEIVREGFRMLLELEDDITVAGEASTGHEAIELAKKLEPDVIVMDIAMPHLNGLEATRQIIKLKPTSQVLFLSAHADDGYVDKSLSFGAAGFLIKQCSSHLLVQAIRDINNGKRVFSPAIRARVYKRKSQSLNKVQSDVLDGPPLSPREMEVLQLIAEGKANKQVAGVLGISTKTVEKHRQNLMEKLKIHDTAGLTRYAISEGIIENSVQKTTSRI